MATGNRLPVSEVAPTTSSDVGDGRALARTTQAQASELLLAEVQQDRSIAGAPQRSGRGPEGAVNFAVNQYLNPSSDIFTVKSGEFKGMRVPEQLRCAIFASNVAVAAGIISPSEVTVRAIDFAQTIKRHGYQEQTFRPGQHYPPGSYILGVGANDGTNSRHIALVGRGDRIIHTHNGSIVDWPISQKFSAGAYDSMKVYIPPKR